MINSPKGRGGMIGFMGVSSPRGLDFSGSGFRSDRSSEGSGSARSREDLTSSGGKGDMKASVDSLEGNKSEAKVEEAKEKPIKVKEFAKEEVTFFLKHAILI